MKHTECKDCELSKGDCGHHFKMDETINYDIASLSACDKYGNCEFYKSKAKPKGDILSMEIVAGKCPIEAGGNCPLRPQGKWIKKIDNVGFISHICSNCGAEIELEDPCDDKFCFNCGAKMEMTKNDK